MAFICFKYNKGAENYVHKMFLDKARNHHNFILLELPRETFKRADKYREYPEYEGCIVVEGVG